jgi:hypothetical protein
MRFDCVNLKEKKKKFKFVVLLCSVQMRADCEKLRQKRKENFKNKI